MDTSIQYYGTEEQEPRERVVLWSTLGWFMLLFVAARVWNIVPDWFFQIGLSSTVAIAGIAAYRELGLLTLDEELPVFREICKLTVLAVSVAILAGDWKMVGLFCLYEAFGFLAFMAWYLVTDNNTKSQLLAFATLIVCAFLNVLGPAIVWIMGGILAIVVFLAVWAFLSFWGDLNRHHKEDEAEADLCTA